MALIYLSQLAMLAGLIIIDYI